MHLGSGQYHSFILPQKMQKENISSNISCRSYGSSSLPHSHRKCWSSKCSLRIYEILWFLHNVDSGYLLTLAIFSEIKRKRDQLCDEFRSVRKCFKWKDFHKFEFWLPLNISMRGYYISDGSPVNIKKTNWDHSWGNSELEFGWLITFTCYYNNNISCRCRVKREKSLRIKIHSHKKILRIKKWI